VHLASQPPLACTTRLPVHMYLPFSYVSGCLVHLCEAPRLLLVRSLMQRASHVPQRVFRFGNEFVQLFLAVLLLRIR